MPSDDDGFLGDLFDFDGDGHTDAGEEFLAYMMFEEMTKENEDQRSVNGYRHTNYPFGYDAKRTGSSDAKMKIPEYATVEQYRKLRRAFAAEALTSLLVALVLCVIPVFFVYVALSVCNPKNETSVTLAFLFVFAGIGAVVLIFVALYHTLAPDWKRLKLAKEAYWKTLSQNEDHNS